jgi:hypothetical protein
MKIQKIGDGDFIIDTCPACRNSSLAKRGFYCMFLKRAIISKKIPKDCPLDDIIQVEINDLDFSTDIAERVRKVLINNASKLDKVLIVLKKKG